MNKFIKFIIAALLVASVSCFVSAAEVSKKDSYTLSSVAATVRSDGKVGALFEYVKDGKIVEEEVEFSTLDETTKEIINVILICNGKVSVNVIARVETNKVRRKTNNKLKKSNISLRWEAK